MEQKPSIGRIVHYVQYEGNKCRAAIITDVEDDGTVGLYVMTPDRGAHSQNECPYDDGHTYGTWHWPTRT
ncbi:hypothetical protein FHR83_006696 [Actinoplanes campanulatus]|uniref:Uncharacterized protein n=1 Tax=Actinoplanes campanulatus TaxID=113559 RepID=A0A7W5AMV6_9ACTN|nr:hypothetical protein [Actinoplanes campanulatus]MBB3098990.1 hypothetical protein [Actinoplanes campanulatus]GGN39543.1 hypothetical protein GCM10010109_67600 [Actinoplanes campanulatus]GID40150.1 hypothetical protein Aca09nite_66560 [Actinoplanes campanulatus]